MLSGNRAMVHVVLRLIADLLLDTSRPGRPHTSRGAFRFGIMRRAARPCLGREAD